mgnify:CR=1 FL=1
MFDTPSPPTFPFTPTFHVTPTFPFTPSFSSWLNAVEGFFATLARRRLTHGVFRSVVDLQAAINSFVAERNSDGAGPFAWRADPEAIIASRGRGVQALEAIHQVGVVPRPCLSPPASERAPSPRCSLPWATIPTHEIQRRLREAMRRLPGPGIERKDQAPAPRAVAGPGVRTQLPPVSPASACEAIRHPRVRQAQKREGKVASRDPALSQTPYRRRNLPPSLPAAASRNCRKSALTDGGASTLR